MIRKFEILANIAVVIAAVVLGSVLIKKYLIVKSETGADRMTSSRTPPNAESQRTRPKVGSKLSLDGIDWSKSERTLVLALSTKCRFCTESASFYKRLHELKPRNVRLIAVMPQPLDESRSYLGKNNISVSELVQAPLASIAVPATPTVILIDSRGSVIDSWMGKLSDSESERVLARISQFK